MARKRTRKSIGQKLANSANKQLFVGRKSQIEQFQQNLQLGSEDDNYHNIFNIFGQGGVGKTTLVEKFQSLCKAKNYLTVYIDMEDSSLYEVTKIMNFIAEELEKQGKGTALIKNPFAFERFNKKYEIYIKTKGDLENDPNRPKGLLGKLVEEGVKIGMEEIPGSGLFFGISDTITEKAGEWTDYVAKKISNKENRKLMLHPLKTLTPLWLADLYDIWEEQNIALFFDTFEAANPQVEQWLFDMLNGKYGNMPSILLSISGRDDLVIEKWKIFERLMHRISLKAFTEEEATNYLTQKGITQTKLVQSILQISQCLPVYLSLLSDMDYTTPDTLLTPNDKVVALFLKHIQGPIQRNLAIHAALPSRLNQDIVECLLPKMAKEKANIYFEWLKNQPFVHKRGRQWVYHPIVREMMLRYQVELSEKEWRTKHQSLVKWYVNKEVNLEANTNQNDWFRNDNYRKLLLEKYFHLLCINYKQHVPDLIQDFVTLIILEMYQEAYLFATMLDKVQHFLHMSQDLGFILKNGIEGILNGNNELALNMFKRLNETDWLNDKIQQSFVHFQQGLFESNPKEKINCYKEAIAIKPDYYQAYSEIGVFYATQGLLSEAANYYEQALNINPNHYETKYNLGLSYFYRNRQQYRVKLKSIELFGFKSINKDGQKIHFQDDAVVLLGSNGSGKSNFISFFTMLNQFSQTAFQSFIAENDFANAFLFYGIKQTQDIRIVIRFCFASTPSMILKYSLVLSSDSVNNFLFEKEILQSDTKHIFLENNEARKDSIITGINTLENFEVNLFTQKTLKLGESERKSLTSEEKQKLEKQIINIGAMKSLLALCSDCQTYQFHDTSKSSPIKGKGYINDNKKLNADGSNLAAYLYFLQIKHKKYYDRIVRYIQKVFPKFGNFDLYPSPLNENYISLNWREKKSDYLFGPHQLSDGSLRFMCLATLLLQPPELIMPVIILDEPELGLHPSAISILVGMINIATENAQVIMATQSTRLVDEFEARNIVIVERNQETDATEFKTLDEEKLKEWLEEYSLSELWEKNVFGGRP